MTKKELQKQIKALDPKGAGKKATASRSLAELEGLLEQARKASAKREAARAREERNAAWEEVFGTLQDAPRYVITDKESYDALAVATTRLRDTLYRYNELCRGVHFIEQYVSMLEEAWRAYRNETVFPNGLQVTEGDLEVQIMNLRGLMKIALRTPEI